MVSMTKKLFAKWKIIFIALINFSNHKHFSPVSYWKKRAIKLADSTLKHTIGAIRSLQCCSLNPYSCFKDKHYHKYIIKVQKQPSRCVLRKGCSKKYAANLQENTYAEVWFQFALQLYWNRTSACVVSCKFATSF